MTALNLSQARDAVFSRLGTPQDGALNPALVTVVTENLNAAQRQLSTAHGWLRVRKTQDVSFTASNPVAVPATQDLEPGRILSAFWAGATATNRRTLGIGVSTWLEKSATAGVPERFTLRKRATGGVAGDYELVIGPRPSENGTLTVDYYGTPADLVLDSDALTIDSEAVVLMAAVLSAPMVQFAGAQDLKAALDAYLKKLAEVAG